MSGLILLETHSLQRLIFESGLFLRAAYSCAGTVYYVNIYGLENLYHRTMLAVNKQMNHIYVFYIFRKNITSKVYVSLTTTLPLVHFKVGSTNRIIFFDPLNSRSEEVA